MDRYELLAILVLIVLVSPILVGIYLMFRGRKPAHRDVESADSPPADSPEADSGPAFGVTLFSGKPFIFWAITPVVVIFLICMPFLTPEWNSTTIVMMAAFWVAGIALILGLFDPAKFDWALRLLCGMVFLTYTGYLLVELVENDWKLVAPRSRGEANPVNALMGLIIIGIPALIYAVRGGFTSSVRDYQRHYELLLKELAEAGLLADGRYEASRAFEIEQFEDEGSHYMIELKDGSVLYLNGQYLYDYEPIEDDPELNQPRSFPCSEFTICRQRPRGCIVSIDCGGEVIEPECVMPYFSDRAFKESLVPVDGQIVKERTYDKLKAELMSEDLDGEIS